MFLLAVLAFCVVLAMGGLKVVKPLLHLLSVLLMLPGLFFTAAILFLSEVKTRGLFFFFDGIAAFIIAMYPWGTVVLLVCFVLLLLTGFTAHWRRVGSASVAALVVGSAVVMHWVAGLPNDSGEWWLFVPGGLALLIAGGLFATTRPSAGAFGLQWPGGPRIDRELREDALAQFQGQPGFRLREVGLDGWTWYHLPAFQDGPLTIDIELGFQDGALRQISLFHDDPAFYGDIGAVAPTNREHLRAEKTRAWLRAKGFPVGSYSWGEVWANYDPRSDFGSGGVRYTTALVDGVVTTDPPRVPAARRLPTDLSDTTGKTLLGPIN